jgi:hypothetical protein
MKNLNIIIKQIENREGDFIAFVKSDFLKATFAVFFNDNIYGGVALHDFAEMVKIKYEVERINFNISGEKLSFQTSSLLDVMITKRGTP